MPLTEQEEERAITACLQEYVRTSGIVPLDEPVTPELEKEIKGEG